MPAVSTEKAIERLTKKIEDDLDPDELLEIYNELFEDHPYTSEEAHGDSFPIIEQLANHLKKGLDPEEILQMWNLVCPSDRHVWYDEAEGVYHYIEEIPEAVD